MKVVRINQSAQTNRIRESFTKSQEDNETISKIHELINKCSISKKLYEEILVLAKKIHNDEMRNLWTSHCEKKIQSLVNNPALKSDDQG